jgi:hypothetical protein
MRMFDVFYSTKAAHLADLQKMFPGRGHCYMTPVSGPQRAVSVSLENASRLLTEGGWRVSTPEEVTEWERSQELAAAQSRPVAGIDGARALFAALNDSKGAKPR